MRSDLLVIKAGSAFLCARPDGDIRPPTAEGEGLYLDDGRFLSELRVTLGGADPVLLSSSTESSYRAVVEGTNPALADQSGAKIASDTISLRRTMLIDGRLQLLIEVESFEPSSIDVALELWLDADFSDLFEVRGAYVRPERTPAMPARTTDSTLVFARQGDDGRPRQTVVELVPAPTVLNAAAHPAHVVWDLVLAPRSPTQILITVTPSVDSRPIAARSFADTAAELEQEAADWLGRCTQIKTDNVLFQDVIDASARDLHALMTPAGDGMIPAAGIPWYVATFGRDSLLTALESLILNPAIACQTLKVLAALQAREDDPWRDSEPGKILHELRAGELARAGLIPHSPYYGTVDATPLFVALAASYFRWTADRETLRELWPSIEAALQWIDRYGDQDGDGFIEYECRSPGGLRNQGWKDWDNSIVHRDGSLAEGAIALVEAQGYVYLAKSQIADVFESFGQADRARCLRSQAQELRAAFNDVFWNPDEATFALALDGRKRQVASVSSNPGHCLYCGIVDEDKADQVVRRLMAPDMFSGWGIRTLSTDATAYNPMSYHNGSVWPHDNAIIAAGLKRYGHHESTTRVARALFEIAARARDHRLAELYCGFARRQGSGVVGYPVACVPQAWAAAAPFMLLEAMLGLMPDASGQMLSLTAPTTPHAAGQVQLHGLRVGETETDLVITPGGLSSVVHRVGELKVLSDSAPPAT